VYHAGIIPEERAAEAEEYRAGEPCSTSFMDQASSQGREELEIMDLRALATLVYGAHIALGGIIGYVAAKSKPSLLSGGILGAVIIMGSVLLFSGNPAGLPIAVATTLLISVYFGYKLLKGLAARKPVGRAAGILVLSVIELLILFFVSPGVR
jgi:uncharacterized membrane protein (UPF0136 family)